MPISEKYRDMGTIIVGKVEAGRLRNGSKLIVMPNKVRVLLSLSTEVKASVSCPLLTCWVRQTDTHRSAGHLQRNRR